MTDSVLARFNFTGRRRIEQDAAYVDLLVEDEQVRGKVVIRRREDFVAFEPTARVVLEIARRTSVEHIELGIVSELEDGVPFSSRSFTELDGLKLSIRVVSAEPTSRGKLLGLASRVTVPGGEQPSEDPLILFQKSDSLDSEIWKISFDDEIPTLFINSAIEDWEGTAMSLPFQALVYPEIVRRVAYWFADEFDDEEDVGDCLAGWSKFFSHLGSPFSGVDRNEPMQIREWADSCAQLFAIRWQYVVKYLNEDDSE